MADRTIYAICSEQGLLLTDRTFTTTDAAMGYMDEFSGEMWRELMAEDGPVVEAAVPTLEWHPTDPPGWADQTKPAFAGLTGDAENPAYVAALTLIEHA